MALTTVQSGMMDSIAQYNSFKNRIINGAMVIDQRNAGASVATSSGTTVFTVDRFPVFYSQTSKFTAQQNAGSVTPPAGFTNYLGITSSSAYSVLTGDYFLIGHRVEGFNAADLAWGTANAATVTLSFRVYSSLTGTFGGSIINNAQNRSYPFTYTISSANTWTTISVTIAGDTSGTWLTNNSIGLTVFLGLGAGATYSGTAGAWAGAAYFSATGATSVVGTSGATFYITGVQLEKGSTATAFDYRPYTTELQLCQRYFCRLGSGAWGFIYSATNADTGVQFPVTMRASPTVSHLANYSLVSIALASYTVTNTVINPSASNSVNGMFLRLTSSGMSVSTQACIASESNVGFSAEL